MGPPTEPLHYPEIRFDAECFEVFRRERPISFAVALFSSLSTCLALPINHFDNHLRGLRRSAVTKDENTRVVEGCQENLEVQICLKHHTLQLFKQPVIIVIIRVEVALRDVDGVGLGLLVDCKSHRIVCLDALNGGAEVLGFDVEPLRSL